MVVETRSKVKSDKNGTTPKLYTSTALAQIYLIKWLVAFGIGILHTLLVNLVYNHVPMPYMDELFHTNQTQAYCKGDWSYWNNKLTTPPLIYTIAALFGFCGRERYLNSAIMPLSFVGLTRLRLAWTNGHNNFKDAILCSIAILSLPVLFGTNLLFYTDLLSLTLVVFAMGTPTPTLSAILFILSLLSRQNNIIWALFYCIQNLQNDFDSKRPYISTFLCVVRHWAFALIGAGFVVFFVKNDYSIVLGDKSAHQLHFHVPQLFYFAGFALASSLPIAYAYQRQLYKHLYRNIFVYTLIGLLMVPIIHYFSYTHLYLLSDNRHFTFYIWRRWFLKGPIYKYITIPIYVISLAYLFVTMRHLRPLTLLGGFFVIFTVVVPAHLVEFRYFIIPYALWRLNVHKSNTTRLIIEITIHLIFNILTLCLFLYRPFTWPNEPGNLQRFMW